MSAGPITTRFTPGEVLATAARWALGGLFIYMGMTKALHPEAFLKLVRQYELVGTPFLLNAIAAGLPWFEVFCGLLLVAGIAVRGAALMLVLMLIPFTTVVVKHALALAAAQGVTFWKVKFDCGCGTGEVVIWKKVVENTVFVLLLCWLSGRGQLLAARFSLFGAYEPKSAMAEPSAQPNARKMAGHEFPSPLPSPGTIQRPTGENRTNRGI